MGSYVAPKKIQVFEEPKVDSKTKVSANFDLFATTKPKKNEVKAKPIPQIQKVQEVKV